MKRPDKSWKKMKLFTSLLFLGVTAVPCANVFSALPNPPGSVLVIYTDDSCADSCLNPVAPVNPNGAANIQAALQAIPTPYTPAVTLDEVTCSTSQSNGIGLTAAQLEQYCLVMDIRFISCPTVNDCPKSESDVITASDTAAYLAFLAQGGHLFLDGDNSGFCPRDQSIISFVSAATGCGIGYPGTTGSPVTFTTFNGPLQNADNPLTDFLTDWPGTVSPVSICGATAQISNASGVLDMYWTSNQLTTGAGTLEVLFDNNALTEDSATCCQGGGYNAQYIQNVYALNGTCFNLSVSKTASPVSVCLGGSVTFTVCVTNTGSRTITNPLITDVIPSCLQFQSSIPAGGSMSGTTFIYNSSATLTTTNPSTCVDIISKAVTTTCP